MDLELPGIPNIHCHAFQRAMAGLAERQSERQDSFWTWRELMYRFAGRVGPESLRRWVRTRGPRQACREGRRKP